jgi:hypothetical protein
MSTNDKDLNPSAFADLAKEVLRQQEPRSSTPTDTAVCAYKKVSEALAPKRLPR